MNKEKMIKGQKTNVIILIAFYVIVIVIILANSLTPSFLSITLFIVQLILVAIMWFVAKSGSVISGVIGIIIGLLIILGSNFITFFLGLMLVIDSIMYITKINKV